MKIKNLILSLFVSLSCLSSLFAQIQPSDLPRVIQTGPWKAGHVQGIAVDTQRKYIYFSFTTMLVKTDLQGNVIGTVTGLLGHLGCLDFNDADGRVYGSLEYKKDQIGKGILKMVNSDRQLDNAFYIAIFDVSKINRMNMDAEKDSIMTSVYLPTVLDDYLANVSTQKGAVEHRFGCSGIDGVGFGPKFGKTNGRNYLTVAYGIYSDLNRDDNDYQVLLQYDTRKWKRYEKALSQGNMHKNGPKKPDCRYFAYTGNTSYGIQNLEYDKATSTWFAVVYNGKKPQYPNYSIFALDGTVKPRKQTLKGIDYCKKEYVVPLKNEGKKDPETGICGWMFDGGQTGFCSLGNGYFYISHNSGSKKVGQSSKVVLYRFTGNAEKPFEEVK